MRDLEIRGAGELLGTRQHGHIQAVGFHLYTRLLADAVRQIRRVEVSRENGKEKVESGKVALPFSTFQQPISMPVNVDLPLAVGIPASYIADQDLRLRLYRRIADLRDETEIEALSSEFKDRFGELPEMVENLFYQMRVKLLAEQAGLSAINWESGQIVLRYPPLNDDKEGMRLPDLGPGIRGGKNAYWCSFGREMDWDSRLLDVLRMIVNQRLT
jgi:transcription-repair coupling factor (superfamily II helicase)